MPAIFNCLYFIANQLKGRLPPFERSHKHHTKKEQHHPKALPLSFPYRSSPSNHSIGFFPLSSSAILSARTFQLMKPPFIIGSPVKGL